MSVTLRAQGDWSSTLDAWPTGTQVGDMAVLVTVGWAPSLPGWTLHASQPCAPSYNQVVTTDNTAVGFAAVAASSSRHAVYSRRVTSLSSGFPGSVSSALYPTEGRIIVLASAKEPTFVTKYGWDSTIQRPRRYAQGQAWFLVVDPYEPIEATGLTLLTGEGRGGPVGSDSFRAYARVGYTTDADILVRSAEVVLGWDVDVQEAPFDPLPYYPTAGVDVSASSDASFEWQHRPSVTSGYQDRARVRFRQTGTSTWYYVTDAGGSSTSETTLVTSEQTASLTAGNLTAGLSYEWQVATRDGINEKWSAYSAADTFDAVTPPSVVVTAPTTVSDDLTPTVTWTPTTPAGSQTAFVVTVAELGYTSGVRRSSDTSFDLPVLDWDNGNTYTAGVMIQQTGDSWSSEATREFTLSWTPPTAPTCTASDTPSTGGVTVTVSGVGSGDEADVQRTLNGLDWENVQTGIVSDGSNITVVDVAVPYQAAVVYRARTATYLDDHRLTSSWDVATEVTCTDTRGYLVDRDDPSNAVEVLVRSTGDRTRRRPTAVQYPLGSSRPVVQHAPYQGQEGVVVVQVSSESDLEAVAELVGTADDTTAVPLILRFPPDTGGTAEPTLNVAVTGDTTWTRVGHSGSPYRDVTLTWVEQ